LQAFPATGQTKQTHLTAMMSTDDHPTTVDGEPAVKVKAGGQHGVQLLNVAKIHYYNSVTH
jgi:hypothetical protein